MNEAAVYLLSFGEALKKARKQKRLTQKQLAQRLGVHANTISAWEVGSYLPETRGLVLELAHILCLDQEGTRQLLEASLTKPAPYWSVPFLRNPFFTGRQDLLNELAARLNNDRDGAPARLYTLYGLGGIGKTQVALEYAYRHALRYSAIFWISAETGEHIVSSMLRIADVLQLPERNEPDQQQALEAVQRWLTTHHRWLLIWDNVENLELVLRRVPSTHRGTMLLTTRHEALGTLAHGMALSPLEREEGIQFVLRRARLCDAVVTSRWPGQTAEEKSAEYALAARLVKTLEGLPLALDQAGAYIEETGCGLAGYLSLFEQQCARLLARRGQASCDHPYSVATTFALAMVRVEREQPSAGDLLRVCAFLHADAIPAEFFSAGAVHLGPVLQGLASDPVQLDRALAALRTFSLVQHQPETQTLSLHRLLQVVMREQMDEQEQALWVQRIIRALATVFPTEDEADWEQCDRYLAQVFHCAPDMMRVGKDLPETGELFYKAGSYLIERGRLEDAEWLLEQAIVLGQQQCGSAHPALIPRLMRQAKLSWKQGRYELAELRLRRILFIEEQHKEFDHPQIAETFNNLALLYWEQGKYDQAEALYLRALDIYEQTSGPDCPELGITLGNLALLYWKQGTYERGEQLYQRALRLQEQVLGLAHPGLGTAFANLAALYRAQGKYELAESLFQHALTMQEQALGAEHPGLGVTLNNLAFLYVDQQRYAQAEQLFQRALCIQEQALGVEHPELAYPLNGLAILYTAQAQYQRAEALLQRALRIRECHLSAEHPELAETLHNLAKIRQKQQRTTEALAIAERALTMRRRALGSNHRKTLETQTLLVQLEQAEAERT